MDQASVSEALAELGGVARRAALIRACGRRAVDAALASEELVVVGRHYTSPEVDAARAEAASVSGVLCLRSAALARGWAVLTSPPRVEVCVPRKRKVAAAAQRRLALRWVDLGPDDVDGDRTSPDRTLADCLRTLPFPEALAVADSALREGFPPARLLALARDARGPGAARARRVAAAADGRAANPFESALRVICLEVEGLEVEPQVTIRDPHLLGRPDLTDARLKVVLEADSFAWHGDRAALHRDANRYNALVAAGWVVLRFSWEEVMFHPERVRAVLEAVVAARTDQLCVGCRAA
ncbi:hypothetical protein GCM10009812_05200 [Nocardioides marinus]|uniref:Very-short-patch-repair endonuclease n=1 Tax=Nocardioides marinus TaxID=374514 RepID=A0A7Y9YB72_9ACTN|nr:DUF559 domain-containing protein [Nocardioides marinus]NYI08961.1 very-short-patch-repair endonuclease [Nocardioides marinus]